MGKYSCLLTTLEVCELECKEAYQILNKYRVPTDEAELVIGMIKQAYYLLSQSYETSRKVEEILGPEMVAEVGKKLIAKRIEELEANRKAHEGD